MWILCVLSLLLSSAVGQDQVVPPSATTAPDTWYKGCFRIPQWLNNTQLLAMDGLVQLPNLTPASCSSHCLDTNEKLFALLWDANKCFCSNALTSSLKTTEDACVKKCVGDDKIVCGSRTTASVYSVHGPYVSSMDVLVTTNSAEPHEIIRFTINIDLASKASKLTGLPQYAGLNFADIKLSVNFENKLKTFDVRANEENAKIAIDYSFTHTGINILDFDACNPISCFSFRHYITVATPYPDRLRTIFVNSYIPRPSCAPKALTTPGFGDSLYGREIKIFAGSTVKFEASVAGGSELTFQWDVCGREVRRSARYLKDESCAVSKCREDIQRFVFNEAGVCVVDVSVWNRHGVLNETLTLMVVNPEMTGLEVQVVSSESADYEEAIMEGASIPPWEENSRWGLSESYYDVSPSTDMGGFSRFNDAPYSQQGGGWLEYENEGNLMPTEPSLPEELPEKYKIDEMVYFKASLYMTSMPYVTNITVTYGDGEVLEERIELSSDHRMRRSTSSREGLFPEEATGIDPYAIIGGMGARSSEFYIVTPAPTIKSNVTAKYENGGCHLNLFFNHSYSYGGSFNVFVTVRNGTHSLVASLEEHVDVIEDGNKFNITCPEFTEVQKSVRLNTTANNLSIDYYIWKIKKIIVEDETTEITEHIFEEISDISQTTFDSYLDKMFVLPGLYEVVVYAHRMDLSNVRASCIVQAQIPLANLSVSLSDNYHVVTEKLINITVEVSEGSYPHYEWIGPIFSDNSPTKQNYNLISLNRPICYTWSVVASNKVSSLQSDIYTICGEHEIKGLKIEAPSFIEAGKNADIAIKFSSGTNVNLLIKIETISGKVIARHIRDKLDWTKTGVVIGLPATNGHHTFRVVAEASNTVSLSECPPNTIHVTKDVRIGTKFEEEDTVSLSHYFFKSGSALAKHVVVVAKINNTIHRSNQVLYYWVLVREVNSGSELVQQKSNHVSAIPFVNFDIKLCSFIPRNINSKWTSCQISVKVASLSTELYATKLFSNESTSPLYNTSLLPHAAVTPPGASMELEIICFPTHNQNEMCEISFGDGSNNMRLASNAYWNSISHAYNTPGLYEIKLTKGKPINTTIIAVQNTISKATLQGSDEIYLELEQIGSWSIEMASGTHTVCLWTVVLETEGDTLISQHTTSKDWEFLFQAIGTYRINVEVFNEVSSVKLSKLITVKSVQWNFVVDVDDAFVGKETEVKIITNATDKTLLSADILNEDGVALACLEKVEDERQNTYIVRHTFENSGPHSLDFSLLIPNDANTLVQTYTLEFVVKRKEQEKRLTLSVDKSIKQDGKAYIVPIKKNLVISASTNFPTEVFKWNVVQKTNVADNMIVSSDISAQNKSLAQLSHFVQDKGYYEVFVTSQPLNISSTMLFVAEEPVDRVRLNYPYSPLLDRYFDHCKLYEQNGNMQCDNITISARCDGSHVNFALNIQYKVNEWDEKIENYQTVVQSGSKIMDPNLSLRFTYETEFEYTFEQRGVYYLNVTAYNRLSSVTTSVSSKNWDPLEPFVFYVEEAPSSISFPQNIYYVEVGKPLILQLDIEKAKQNISIDWHLEDGVVLRNKGYTITYTYNNLGRFRVYARGSNKVGATRTKTIQVYVQERLKYVYLKQPEEIVSTEDSIKLEAYVNNGTRVHYEWYTGLNDKTTTYDNTHVITFREAGTHLVKVVARNDVSSVESDMIIIEAQEYIRRVSLISESVVLVNSSTTLEVDMRLGSNVLVNWRIDDGFEIDGVYSFNHTFKRLGVYNIQVHLTNGLGKIVRNKKVFVVGKMCQLPELHFTNQLPIVERSKRLQLELKTSIKCSYLARLKYNWMAYKKPNDKSYCTENIRNYQPNFLEGHIIDESTLNLPPNSLEYGIYCLAVNVSVEGSNLYGIKMTHFRVAESNLVPYIDGPKVRQVARSNVVTMDASRSYDPDFPKDKSMQFEWECFILESPKKACFIPELGLSNHNGSNNMRADLPYMHENGYYADEDDMDAYKTFPLDIKRNESILSFPAYRLDPTASSFIFKVIIKKKRRIDYEAAVVSITNHPVQEIDIECPACFQQSVIRESSLVFSGSCKTCPPSTKVQYHWSLQEVEDANTKSFHQNETSDCAPPDGSGWALRLVGQKDNATSTEQFLNVNLTNTEDGTFTDDPNFIGVLPPYPKFNNGSSAGIDEQSPAEETRLLLMPGPEDNILEGLTPDALYDEALDPHLVESAYNFDVAGINLNGGDNMRTTSNFDPYSLTEGIAGGREVNFMPYTSSENGQQNPRYPDEYALISELAPRSGFVFMNQQIPAFENADDNNHIPTGDYVYDAFIDGESTALPVYKHYQDMKHLSVNLKSKAANGINQKDLILKPNTVMQGKTYALKLKVTHQDEDGSEQSSNASYYFSVRRGPSYGECSVVDENHGNMFRVHCAQWQNRQNNNKNSISRNEVLKYQISYSLTRDGEKRLLYSGVGFEQKFQLPDQMREEYIHIKLINSDGATTNVCSFPTNTSTEKLSAEDKLNIVYNMTVTERSKLHEDVARQDKKSIVGRINVLLDTLPKIDESWLNDETLSRVNEVLVEIVIALNTIKIRSYVEVEHMTSILTRLLSIPIPKTSNVAHSSSGILVYVTTSVNEVTKDGKETMTYQQALNLVRLIAECKALLVTEANNMGKNNLKAFEIIQDLKKTDKSLEQFMVHIVSKKKIFLVNSLKVEAGNCGIAVGGKQNSLSLFNASSTDGAQWAVGAIFPKSISENNLLSLYTYTNDSFPQSYFRTIAKDEIMSVVSISVWDKKGRKISVKNLEEPIRIALPSNTHEESEIQWLSKGKVNEHAFDVVPSLNQTLHIEFTMDPRDTKPFPIAFRLAHVNNFSPKKSASFDEEYIKNQFVTKNNFEWARKQNKTIRVKWIFAASDLKYGLHSIIIKNQDHTRALSLYKDGEGFPYKLNIWWSDCIYWDENLKEWKTNGVKVVKESTYKQTVCTSSHLTMFSANFKPVLYQLSSSDITMGLSMMALPGVLGVTFILLFIFGILFYCNHKYLQPLDSAFMRENKHSLHDQKDHLMTKLRWFLGPERKAVKNCGHVLLPEYKAEHEQKFEIIVKTGAWSGSGTTSTVTVAIYGEHGKYDARELISQRMHKMREQKFENTMFNDIHEEESNYEDEELLITGSTQTFVTSFPKHLGPLWKIAVWHDNSGEFPSWFLDCIIIQDKSTEQQWYFPCHQYLSEKYAECSLHTELRPIISLPPLHQQLAVYFKTFTNRYHSLTSIYTSPAYGPASRFQRLVHLTSILLLIMALSSIPYLFNWRSYSADTDLPYIHLKGIINGIVISFIAWVIFILPQVILRLSKRDERISVIMEDITSSTSRGSQLIDDHVLPSSTMSKHPTHNYEHFKDVLQQSGKDFSKISGIISNYPTAQDIVFDWLEMKSEFDDKRYTSCNTLAGTEIGFENFAQSVVSIDEELLKCMEPKTSIQVKASVENCGTEDHNALRCMSSVSQGFGNYQSMSIENINYTEEIEYDKVSVQKSVLAMDGPELVPFEKLEPLPQFQSAPLPKFCAKLVMLFYALMCIGSIGVLLYTSAVYMYHMDFHPWFEEVLFGFIFCFFITEPVVLMFLSVLIFLVKKLSIRKSWERVETFCKFAYPSDKSTMSTQNYSAPPKHDSGGNTFTFADTIVTDEEVARELADRERSRYLRHAAPPKAQKLTKVQREKHQLKMMSLNWFQLLFIIVVSVMLVSTLSAGISHQRTQSDDIKFIIENGFLLENSEYLFVIKQDFRQMNASIKTVTDKGKLVDWINNVFTSSSKQESQNYVLEELRRHPEDEVLVEMKKHQSGYYLIGKPVVHFHYQNTHHGDCNREMQMVEQITKSTFCSKNKEVDKDRSFKLNLMDNIKINISEQQLDQVSSTSVNFLLYSPQNNLHSSVKIKTSFAKNVVDENMWKINVDTIMLEDTTSSSKACKSTRNIFFLCQILVLFWMFFYSTKFALHAMRALMISFQRGSLKRQGNVSKSTGIRNHVDFLFTFCVFVLFTIFLACSAKTRLLTESIQNLAQHMYESDNNFLAHTFEDIGIYTQALSIVAGLLFFMLCVRFYCLATLHMCPSRMSGFYCYYVKIVAGAFVMIMVHSFIGYIAFSQTKAYSTFLASWSNTMLLSTSLGLLGGSSDGLKELKHNYGYAMAIIYLFALWIIFRVMIKGIIIATVSKTKHKASKRTKSNHTGKTERKKLVSTTKDDSVSFTIMLRYNVDVLKQSLWLLYTFLSNQNIKMSSLKAHFEFSPFGMGKKSIREYQRRKLGYSASEMTKCTGVFEDTMSSVCEWKSESRYDLPTDIYLEEIQLQLEEVYSRASALFDDVGNHAKSSAQQLIASRRSSHIGSKDTLQKKSVLSFENDCSENNRSLPMVQKSSVITGSPFSDRRLSFLQKDEIGQSHQWHYKRRLDRRDSFTRVEEDLPALTARNIAEHNHRLSSHGSAASYQQRSSYQSHVTNSEAVTTTRTRQHHQNERNRIGPKMLKSLKLFKSKVRLSESSSKQNRKKKPLRRSRTAGVNLKDLPNLSKLVENKTDNTRWCDRTRRLPPPRENRTKSELTRRHKSANITDSTASFFNTPSVIENGSERDVTGSAVFSDDYSNLPGNVSEVNY